MSFEKTRFFFSTTLWRLAFYYSLMTMVLGLILIAILYRLTIHQQNETLKTHVVLGAESLLESAGDSTEAQFKQSILSRSKKSTSFIYALEQNEQVTGNLSKFPDDLEQVPALNRFPIAVADHLNQTTIRMVLGGYIETPYGRVMIGAYDENFNQYDEQFIRASVIALVMLFVLSMFAGFVLNQRVLARVTEIGRLSSNVIDGQFADRLVLSNHNDEFDYIAIQINKMLDEINYLIHSISSVTSNIAHDLKTPLNRVRNALESYVVESNNNDSKEWAQDLIEELDGLIVTFNALLQLSRLEQKSPNLQKTTLCLKDIVNSVVELLEPIADKRYQTILLEQSSGGGQIVAEKNLVFQAVYNIVENATKYASPNSNVTVRITENEDDVALDVLDEGPGIPEEYLVRVKEKSFRIAQSRSTQGFGIGLSIVEAVMKAHQGQFEIKNTVQGLRVTIVFNKTVSVK